MSKRSTFLAIVVANIVTFSVSINSPNALASSINTRDRAAVLASYNAEFNRIEPSSEWNGDVDTCRSGATSSAYQLSVLQRVNWYRTMAGLPNVSYNNALNQKAQDAALISSAVGALSHTPPTTARCYSTSGRTGTENSNLALGLSGVKAADAYIDDQGDNNTSVGHRAWLLSRTLGGIATGDIEADGARYAANAIYVNGGGGTTATPRDGYIAWPPSGFVPDAVMYARWSFTTGGSGVSYQNAQVAVTGPNGAVPVEINARSGWLEAGIVFTPALPARKVSTDTTYTVNITGITGGTTSSYTYQLTAVHVNEPPRKQSVSAWGAPTCASPLSNIAQVNLLDPEGDATSYRLVAGYGDSDNALFQVNSNGVIQNVGELNVTQTEYHLRYEASDSNGWKIQDTLVVTLRNPVGDTSIVCPGRNLALNLNTKGGVRVSWDNPVTGGAGTWYVFFTPGGSFCSVTTTGCDVSTLKNGTSYKVDLYNARGSWSVPYTVYYTKTGGTSEPEQPATPATLKTLRRGKSAKLATFVAIPSGSRTYVISGPCSVNRSKLLVIASRTKRGTCSIKITGTTRTKTGRLERKSKSIKLRVT